MQRLLLPLFAVWAAALLLSIECRLSSAYPRTTRIAIIGAGPGGTSASYFLAKAQAQLEHLGKGGEGFDVTVFEREERVGGRTAIVHPYNDESLEAIELGASIFADVNLNLRRAAKEFNLSTDARLGVAGTTGIWDGQQFLIEGLDNSWWNSARMLWRYGYSPMKVKTLVSTLVDKFVKLYDPDFLHKPEDGSDNRTTSGYPWKSIEEVAHSNSLNDLAARDAGGFFYEQGVSKLFIEEVVEAATLVNYGQEIYSIHGVGGHVSLAASGAKGVRGGNKKIFEEMLGRSQARLRLGIHGEVTGLARFHTIDDVIAAGKLSKGEAIARGYEIGTGQKETKWWLGTKSGFGDLFDVVLIATPWQSAGITLLNTPATIPTPRYVHLYVTILVTDADQPDPAYFGRGNKDAIPTTILTSHASLRNAQGDVEAHHLKFEQAPLVWFARVMSNPFGAIFMAINRWWPGSGSDEKRGPHLEFNSLNYLAHIPARHRVTNDDEEDDNPKEHVVKIFSPAEMSDEHLEKIFGKDKVLWTFRKDWKAYPYLEPTREFPPLEPDENLYFLNSFESLISTMETSTVSARNAVALVLKKKLGFDFVHGGKNCPWEDKEESQGNDDDVDISLDWAGWGCRSG